MAFFAKTIRGLISRSGSSSERAHAEDFLFGNQEKN